MLKDLKKCGDGWICEDECFWKTKADYICISLLKTCGCGDLRSIMVYVYDMLRSYVSYCIDEPSCEVKYDDIHTMFFLYWADHNGYIEHGCNIRYSWLTGKGKELLSDIEIVMKEDSLKDDEQDGKDE